MAERPAMMNKLSLEETLREQIDGLEAKLESEVIENLQHLGDLRYYEEVQIPELQKQLADARAEIERLDHQRRAGWTEIKRKNKLIEQMYEAIKFSLIADEVRQTRNVCASDINDAYETSRIKRIAALSAAERVLK